MDLTWEETETNDKAQWRQRVAQCTYLDAGWTKILTGEDLLGVLGGHGYSRSAREPQPAGDRCGKVRRNVDTVESHRNGPQLFMRHDDDDELRSKV